MPLRTEQDLEGLLGASESYTLEFKRSEVLTGDNQKIAETLTKVISAFANSEGGQLVIGVREGKGRPPRVAEIVDDGTDPGQLSPERLQQIIVASLHPLLMGLRVHPILLTCAGGTRVAYVIDVPQGSTAYQASDHRYYGRFEYECKALPDNEIRVRMERGRAAAAEIQLVCARLIRYGDRHHYEFDCRVTNVGQLTIHDYRTVIDFEARFDNGMNTPIQPIVQRFRTGTVTVGFEGEHVTQPEEVLFPGESDPFKLSAWLDGGQALAPENRVFRWAIYLDDAPPREGKVIAENVTSLLQEIKDAAEFILRYKNEQQGQLRAAEESPHEG